MILRGEVEAIKKLSVEVSELNRVRYTLHLVVGINPKYGGAQSRADLRIIF